MFATDTIHRAVLRTASAVLCLVCCAVAEAHEGPPYPILVDEPVDGYLVSVWGDPDVGTGTFYVILDPTASSSDATAIPKVDVWVQPSTGRLKKATYPAPLERELQFRADPKFDRQEQWTVGFLVHHPGGETSELVAQVEVTPPGYGPWDLVIYLVPFLLFGGLWCLALLRRWRASRKPANARTSQVIDQTG